MVYILILVYELLSFDISCIRGIILLLFTVANRVRMVELILNLPEKKERKNFSLLIH